MMIGKTEHQTQPTSSSTLAKEERSSESLPATLPPGIVRAYLNRIPTANSQTILLVRGAERMDRIFPQWRSVNVDDCGNYRPNDLNQPSSLPKRTQGLAAFEDDTAITEVGVLSSQMLGRALVMARAPPVRVFCSPALRCIQTANAILSQVTKSEFNKICIEPGLFELGGWYKKIPTFMSNDELTEAKYPIDLDYSPIVTAEKLSGLRCETVRQHYARLGAVVSQISKNSPETGLILVVTHSCCLDAAGRALLKKGIEPMALSDLQHMGVHYPYNSILAMRQTKGSEEWSNCEQLIPYINYVDFSNRINKQFFNR